MKAELPKHEDLFMPTGKNNLDQPASSSQNLATSICGVEGKVHVNGAKRYLRYAT